MNVVLKLYGQIRYYNGALNYQDLFLPLLDCGIVLDPKLELIIEAVGDRDLKPKRIPCWNEVVDGYSLKDDDLKIRELLEYYCYSLNHNGKDAAEERRNCVTMKELVENYNALDCLLQGGDAVNVNKLLNKSVSAVLLFRLRKVILWARLFQYYQHIREVINARHDSLEGNNFFKIMITPPTGTLRMNEELDDPRDAAIYKELVKNTLEGSYFQSADSAFFRYKDDEDDNSTYRKIFKEFFAPPTSKSPTDKNETPNEQNGESEGQEKTLNLSSEIPAKPDVEVIIPAKPDVEVINISSDSVIDVTSKPPGNSQKDDVVEVDPFVLNLKDPLAKAYLEQGEELYKVGTMKEA